MTAGRTVACLSPLRSLLDSLLSALSNLIIRRDEIPREKPYKSSDINSTHWRRFHNFCPFVSRSPKRALVDHESFPARYHDPDSNLTFDIEMPPPRLPRLHHAHSRARASSGLSGLTTVSIPFELHEPCYSAPTRCRAVSRGHLETDIDVRDFRSGYAVSITSGEAVCEGSEEARTIRRIASDEESIWMSRATGPSGEGKDEGLVMGIVRTTTTEVTIT